MELISYIRLARRRWRLLALFTVVGALAGFGFSLLGEDEPRPEEIQTYYAASETLIVRSGETVNLQQTAFFVTAGEVPMRAAAAIGIPDDADVIDSVQAVFDTATNTLVVSGAAETPEGASEVTSATTSALLAELETDLTAVYDEQLEAVAEEIARRESDIGDLDDDIAELVDERAGLTLRLGVAQTQLDTLVEGGANPTLGGTDQASVLSAEIRQLENDIADLDRRIDALQSERDAELGALQEALATRDTLRDQGRPVAPLERLEIGDPYEIDQNEWNARIRAGELGESSYAKGDPSIPRSAGGGGVAESLTDNPPLLIAGGGVVGLLLGVLVIVVQSRVDSRIRTKEDAEEHFGLPVVGEIPVVGKEYKNSTEVLSHTEPYSRYAEAFRSLRSALVYARMIGDAESDAPDSPAGSSNGQDHDEVPDDRTLNVVMVTSPGPGEGKTTTVANLAVMLAEAGYVVLAVNCDYRRPRLAKFLRGAETARRVSPTIVRGVSMIHHVTPEGEKARPSDVIATQRRVIDMARDQFDIVLLDTAPLLATNDANELLPVTDLVLVVAQAGRTTKEMAEKTRELLARRGAPVVGVALVGSTERSPAKGYYYYNARERGGRGRGPTGESHEYDAGPPGRTRPASGFDEELDEQLHASASEARFVVADDGDSDPDEDEAGERVGASDPGKWWRRRR